MLKSFTIVKNRFLQSRDVSGWYSMPYSAYRSNAPAGSTSFLNVLKNFMGNKANARTKRSDEELARARIELAAVLRRDLPELSRTVGKELSVVCVPRSKASFIESQQQFRATVANVVRELPGFSDLTNLVERRIDTKTTHLGTSLPDYNPGDSPYPGIAQKTCAFSSDLRDKVVLLIDDVYTPGVGIDEDFLQACLDNGVREIYFYAVAKTGG